MSGFLGQTKTIENVPGDVKGLRKSFGDYLTKGGFSGLDTGTPDIQAFVDLFTRQNEKNFAQAKESAGNLTGTGYGAKIGQAASDATLQQGSFLTNFLQQAKEANSNRLASVLMPFLNTGVGAPTTAYQPGFLDYALQGGAAVAGAAGQAGGFGKLF